MVRWSQAQYEDYCKRNGKTWAHGVMTRRPRLGPSRAQPTIVDGIRFPSKAEAGVYSKLLAIALAEKSRLYRQVRFPLMNLAPNERGLPAYFTVDFVLVHSDNQREVFDAKRGWRNREWARGKAAFEAEYNLKVKEIEP